MEARGQLAARRLPHSRSQLRSRGDEHALPPVRSAEVRQPRVGDATRVGDKHALTSRLTAASRAVESARPDAIFRDPFAAALAGQEGRPHGHGMTWIVTPRTRFFDDFAWHHYSAGTRQFVLLGAGMDARAFRMGLAGASFFEVDKPALFDVKEPLLAGAPLQCAHRHTVAVDLAVRVGLLEEGLLRGGFDPSQPSCWLLEGLVMYLSNEQATDLFGVIGKLAAPGSSAVHDAVSASYMSVGVEVCGARFLGGSDDYGGLWSKHGFDSSDIIDLEDIGVDRKRCSLRVDPRRRPYHPDDSRGHKRCLFVQVWKTA